MAKWKTGEDGVNKELVQLILSEPAVLLLRSAAALHGMRWTGVGQHGAIIRTLLADSPAVVQVAEENNMTKEELLALFTLKPGGWNKRIKRSASSDNKD